jgi:hypothetical protein
MRSFLNEAGRRVTIGSVKSGTFRALVLLDCSLAKSVGFADHELTRIAQKVRRSRDLFLRAWNDFFGGS